MRLSFAGLPGLRGAQDEGPGTPLPRRPFLGDGAERDSAPARHAVSGDDDHIGVVVLRDSHDFHADVIGSADLCADFERWPEPKNISIAQVCGGVTASFADRITG